MSVVSATDHAAQRNGTATFWAALFQVNTRRRAASSTLVKTRSYLDATRSPLNNLSVFDMPPSPRISCAAGDSAPLWLRLVLHMIVRCSLSHALETQTTVQLERPMVLQPRTESHFLALRMRSRDGVSKHSCSDPAALILWFDLNLADFDGVGVDAFEQLNHAHTSAIDFDGADLAEFQASGEVTPVSIFIPATPRCIEEIAVYGSA